MNFCWFSYVADQIEWSNNRVWTWKSWIRDCCIIILTTTRKHFPPPPPPPICRLIEDISEGWDDQNASWLTRMSSPFLYIYYVIIMHVLLPLQTVKVMASGHLLILTYQHNSCSSCKQHLEILYIAVVNLQIMLFEKQHLLINLREVSKFC